MQVNPMGAADLHEIRRPVRRAGPRDAAPGDRASDGPGRSMRRDARGRRFSPRRAGVELRRGDARGQGPRQAYDTAVRTMGSAGQAWPRGSPRIPQSSGSRHSCRNRPGLGGDAGRPRPNEPSRRMVPAVARHPGNPGLQRVQRAQPAVGERHPVGGTCRGVASPGEADLCTDATEGTLRTPGGESGSADSDVPARIALRGAQA